MAKGKGYRKQFGKQVSRRGAMRAAALSSAGLASAVLLGCGKDENPATTTVGGAPGVSQPKRGGTLSYAGGQVASWDTRGTTLDPHINSPLGAVGFRLFYQGLLAYDFRTYEVQPEIAQKWEQPSQNEYVFDLQPGIKWHNKPPANGRLLTAEDVVFSLNRVQSNDPRFQHRSLFVTVDKIEAVDNTKVRITTKGPDAPMLSKLSADGPLILAPEVVDKAGRFTTADVVVGTGPFIMKSVEESVGAEYVRNPEYWRPGLPYLDGFRTISLKDEQAGYAAFLGGQVDITRLPGTEVKKYIAQQGQSFSPDWAKNGDLVAMPNLNVKPLDDQRVYRALRLLIDHQEWHTAWGEVWFGSGRNGSILPAALDVWDLPHEEYPKYLEWKQPKDDAAKEALSLLNAAGFNQANPLKFELGGTTGGFSTAGNQLLQAQWKRLSQGVVDATIKEYELAQALQTQANRQFSYGYWGITAGGDIDPDPWFAQIYRTGGSRNLMSLSDPRLDAMIDRQRTIFDVAQRKSAVREITLYMMDNSPSTIPYNRFYLNAVRPQLRGYVPEFYLKGRQYEWVWLDT